ncbi:MAG TPA: DUF2293 domain-containing protein [Anaerolineae bacterium]|nr:DUF2293 domain-containing protein [Anaerolineae bacterium]
MQGSQRRRPSCTIFLRQADVWNVQETGIWNQEEVAIAEHACLNYRWRGGPLSRCQGLDEAALRLAVVAHMRDAETPYDTLLASGYKRW